MTLLLPNARLKPRTGQPFLSATPMAEQSLQKRARIPKVAGLVYITAFAPDKGESVAALIKDPPPGAPVPPILPPQEGYLFLDKAKFPASFAADVDPEEAAFMADSQVPLGRGGPQRHNHRTGVEDQTKLVPDCDRRQDDSRPSPSARWPNGQALRW